MGAFNQLNGAIFDAGAIEARLSAIDGKSIYNQRDGGILDMDSLARRLTALDGKVAVGQGGIEFDVDSFMRRLAAIEAGGFNLLSLFAAGEQGILLDPSDFATMYQDVGTTPVTALGQPVGLMLDKRATLSTELNPDPTNSSAAGWTTSSGNVTYSNGVWTVNDPSSNEFVGRQINISKTGPRWYKATIVVTAAIGLSASVLRLYMGSSVGTVGDVVTFPAITGPGTYSVYLLVNTSNPFFTVAVTNAGASVSFSSLSVKDFVGNHLIQATTTSRPTVQQDASGFFYLSFDGVDDGLASAATVDFSATKLLTAWFGLNKTAGTGFQTFVELGATGAGNNFALHAPTSVQADYGFYLEGATTNNFKGTTALYNPPISNVLSWSVDRGAATEALQSTARINGASAALGAGALADNTNFTNSILYVGRRAGTSFPFNGRMYQMILRGATSDAATVSAAERYVGSKMGIAL